jgi:hypothetical protein
MRVQQIILIIITMLVLSSIQFGYSVGPKYEFVLRGKGIVERVAGTFSGCCQ